jgi:hypothetical protein
MKKIGKSDIIGQQGISLIQGIVLSMGFMFYPTGGVEAGIDGSIELRDTETGEVGNLLLQIQGKATERERLQGETEETFEFPCADADIEYWTKGTLPVLLIVVALKTQKAYWKSLKEWFSDPERRKSRKVVFDKAKDEFTRDSKAALISVATAVRPGASGPSVKKSEQLLVNLMEVRFAPRLFWAPTSHGTDKSFGGALGEIVKPTRGEWIVRSKSVLSFHPLDEYPWKKLCDWEAMEEFDTTEWANSDDEDRQRDFVALLNRAIGEFVRPELYRDRDSGVFFFRKPMERNNLNYAYRSLQNITTRRVVGSYGKKKSDPKKPAYWRHSAFLHRFVRLAGKWCAEITPTYHFTYNGQDTDAYAGERLKKIKEIENNAAVMGQFVMWRDFLTTHGAEDLLKKTYPFLSFHALDALDLDVGVTDDLWKSQESDPSSPLFEYALAGETVENVP